MNFHQDAMIRVAWRRLRRRVKNLFSDNPQSSYRVAEVEAAERQYYEDYLREGMTVFDVGANVGALAEFFAGRVGPTGKVHCFEPGEAAFAALKQRQTGLPHGNMILNPVAICNRTGLTRFHVYPEAYSTFNSMAERPLEIDGAELQPQQTREVPCKTLDDYCQDAAIRHIDLVKLDVEGAELQALEGATGLLRQRRINCILMEFGQTTFDMGNRPEDIEAFVTGVGCTVFNLIPGDPLFPGGRSRETAQFAMLKVCPAHD
jgi:FkbM family methyltransferase